ncbi:VCBS domain-containing protein [Microbulbifer sp. MLAF003]|uniref:VCBS domain-containing protein n=1 Tax=unclassified Microbulbifer TaxID=2619833 RepID=UPI0024ADA004|nr:VCBS domain-containing protein [Microbulbifer sp. MLAF003]WHI51712.1 VCBS domain-containing protein [Microbulbifer sp. MLAF003]
MREPLKLLTVFSLSVFLTACGGGSGDSGQSPDDDNANNPVSDGSGDNGDSNNGNDGSDNSTGGNTDTDTGNDTDSNGVISGGEGSVTENVEITTSGQLIDSGNTDQTFEETGLQGKYGNLKVSSDGNWSYTLESNLADPLNANELVTDEFSVGIGSTEKTTTITISVTGTDDAYTFDPGSPLATMIVNSREHANGTMMIEDVDGNTPEFPEETISGSYGEFKLLKNGDWEFTLNNNADSLKEGETAEDTIAFQLTDGTEQSVTFTIATIDPSESSIVFILMNFSDGLATDQGDLTHIANTVFNDKDSLDNAYRENSFGQLKFLRHRINDKSLQHYCYGEPGNEDTSVDCVVFNIPDSENGGTLSIADAVARAEAGQEGEYTDDGFTWRDKAYQWASDNLVDENNQPLNLRNWRHQVFIYPNASYKAGLVGAGVASVGGGMSLVASFSDQNVMGHELGHNIGLSHAGLDSNNDGDTNDSGDSEYGTDGSLMGNRSRSRLFGSAHREYMKWYNLFPEYTTTVEQVSSSSQDVEIEAIELTAGELSGSLPQQLKIESNGSSNGQNHYYVNYHVAHDILNPRPHFEDSVTVHYLNGRTSNHVAVLEQVGDSFTDSKIGLTITYKSSDSIKKSAVITVSYN